MTKYDEEDWNDTFATDGVFGNSTRCSARIWNRYSIIGEIYDNTSDVIGRVTGDVDMPEWGISIFLTEIEGTNYYSTAFLPNDGNFSFQAKPGNYSLELREGYQFDLPQFINVSERETLMLGNLTVEYQLIRHQPTIAYSTLIVIAILSASGIALLIVYKKKVMKGDKQG